MIKIGQNIPQAQFLVIIPLGFLYRGTSSVIPFISASSGSDLHKLAGLLVPV
jgi:hypothetical protein